MSLVTSSGNPVRTIKYTEIKNLDLSSGNYNLKLPKDVLLIEVLISSGASDYSGGNFILPNDVYVYLTNTSLGDGTNRGLYVKCNKEGLVTISSYRNSGAKIKGFRIWY